MSTRCFLSTGPLGPLLNPRSYINVDGLSLRIAFSNLHTVQNKQFASYSQNSSSPSRVPLLNSKDNLSHTFINSDCAFPHFPLGLERNNRNKAPSIQQRPTRVSLRIWILKMGGLEYAQLAIYGLLSLPVLYLTYRHGRHGLTGWLYLFAFCTLKIVGTALQVKADIDHSSSSTAALISSIGLSPLLLAAVGILHEA